MDFAEYDALIQRSNEINAEKVELNRLIDKGKKAIRKNGRRINIADRIKQLNLEHTEVIRKINGSHGTST
jgi:hypothetical protein